MTTVEGWTFDARSGAARAARAAAARRASHGFGLEGHAGGDQRRRRARPLPARHAEGRPRARPRRSRSAPAPTACSIDPTTLRNLEVIESVDGGRTRIAAARDRSHASRRWAAGCCATWLLRPLLALERIQDRLDAVEEFAFRTHRAREGARHAQDACTTSSAWSARAALGHRGPARSGRAAAVARRRFRACGCCSTSCRRRSSAAWPPSSTISRICASDLEAHAARRAAGARPRRRRHPRRRRCRARRAARHQPLRASSASPRWKRPSAPAPASPR